MNCLHNNRRNSHGYGFTEVPETGYTCPICGYDVEWWKEPWQLLKGCVCHEQCLVDMEDEHGSKETG